MFEITFWSRRGSSENWVEEFARRRVERALGRFAASVQKVRISIDDLNGPKGGVDQECRIMVTPRSGAAKFFASRGASAGEALIAAIGKMRRALSG